VTDGPLPEAILDRWFEEDLGDRGDVTSRAVTPETPFEGTVRAREPAVASGLEAVAQVLERAGASVTLQAEAGDRLAEGDPVLGVAGDAVDVLAGERLALNVLQRASGIAAATARTVEAVEGANPDCRVAATRKTTPGFRRVEKRAVVDGGGVPHRWGLHDAFLVKDNHLARAESVEVAVAACRDLDPDLPLEVEADDLATARAAAEAGADWALLDNFPPGEQVEAFEALTADHPDLRVEASGGVTPETASDYAPGAHRVSLGWLTHSAPAADLGLDAD
jgi:nicotinate-nucleotide pyrophosphorylase (carboxylating)